MERVRPEERLEKIRPDESGKVQYPEHYLRWRSMRSRCGSKSSGEYCRYGARGIYVCQEWQSFNAFQAWCRKTYEPGKTLDRIDNDGPYSPANCRWATPAEQQITARRTEARRLGIAIAIKARVAKQAKLRQSDYKACPGCRRSLLKNNFYKRSARPSGIQSRCKECLDASRKKRISKCAGEI